MCLAFAANKSAFKFCYLQKHGNFLEMILLLAEFAAPWSNHLEKVIRESYSGKRTWPTFEKKHVMDVVTLSLCFRKVP